MRGSSIDRINQAIVFLKGANLKATQKKVAEVSSLSLRTVKTYWVHRNKNPDEWYTALYRKINKIKRDKGIYNSAMHKLKTENDSLREQNRILALKALGLEPI